MIQTEFSKFYNQVISPHWVDRPEEWIWVNRQGVLQGPGHLAYEQPGIFNLAWLALGRKMPVASYDGTKNHLLIWVLLTAPLIKLGKGTLEEAAALLPLDRFVVLARTSPVPEIQLLIKEAL